MIDPRSCPQCGAVLPADAPDGLCPKCLLQLGFDSQAAPALDPPGGATVYQPKFLPPSIAELAAHFPQLEILEQIGHGGMGVVYKARQRDLDRIVALKILRPDIGNEPAFAERFVREARALAKLSHPAIVTVHDFGRKDSLYYFVMEYIDGTNLRELERSAQLAPQQALAIVPRICEALQYAHDQGVIHRDIKPENILLDKEGRVKIADFGLAKVLGTAPDAGTLTGAWQVMGTPHYMAPEQMQGAHQVDHRADIYSLGVVIYEMLTGELPVGRFPLPSQKVRVDVRLDDVVLRSLEREPARRYQHASDVKTEIETISRGPAATLSTSTPPPGWYYGLWGTHGPGYADWVRRRLLLWVPIFLILALVALLLGAMAGNLNEPLFGMVMGSSLVLFPLWLLLRKHEQAERRRPRADYEARSVTDDSGRQAGLDEAAGTQTGAQAAQVGSVQSGGEMTAPALTRHAFGFWSKPQAGYDRRVGWPVMALLAIWVVAVLSLIGLNLAGAPIDARIINVALIAGVAGLPVLLIALALAYFVRGRGNAGAADGTGRSAAATDPYSATAAPGTALVAVGVFEWIACWTSCIVLAVAAISYGENVPPWFGDLDTLRLLLPTLFILGAVLSGVVIVAGLKMRRLESRRFALAGSILAMFVSPGNVIGLPIGLWALYALTRPEVKAAYQNAHSGAAPRRDTTFVLRAAVLSLIGAGLFGWALWSPAWSNRLRQLLTGAGGRSEREQPTMPHEEGILQGTWQAVTGERNGGQPLTTEETAGVRVTFERDQMRVAMQGRIDEGVFKLDASQNPRRIAVTRVEGVNRFGIMDGIYELDRDHLRICMGEPEERPTAFKTKAGSRLIALDLVRQTAVGPIAFESVTGQLVQTGMLVISRLGEFSVTFPRPYSGAPTFIFPREQFTGPGRFTVKAATATGFVIEVADAAFTPEQPVRLGWLALGAAGDTPVTESAAGVPTWDEFGTEIRLPIPHPMPTHVAYSADGEQLVAVIGHNRHAWEHKGPLTSLGRKPVESILANALFGRLEPGGDLMTLVCHDGAVELCDLSRDQHVAQLHVAGARCAAFSPDRQTAAVAGDDPGVSVWEVPANRERHSLAADSPVTALAFSADGALLAGACLDGTVRLWEVSSGADLLTLQGLSTEANCIGFAADGERLAAGTFDGALAIWYLPTGHREAMLQAQPGLTSLALSPDGWLALGNVHSGEGNASGSVQRWLRYAAWEGAPLPLGPGRVHTLRVGHVPIVGDDPYLSLAVQGNHAYMIQGNVVKPKRLHVVDVSVPNRPQFVGSCPVAANAGNLSVSGDHVYVLDDPHLRVVDVSDPTAPRTVAMCELGEHLWDLAVQGQYAYVTDIASVRVVDLSDPTAPREVGRCVLEEAQGITVAGSYAYVACNIAGVHVVDVSDPTSPEEVGVFDGPQGAADVVVDGNYAYVAGGEDAVTLWIADISDPRGPRSIGRYGDWIVGSVAVAGGHAFLGGDIVDVSNPAAPVRVGSFAGSDAVVSGDYLYVADGGGLSILRIVRSEQRVAAQPPE